MIPKHKIESVTQNVVEQHLGKTLRDEVLENIVHDIYSNLVSVQEEQEAVQENVHVSEYREEHTRLGHTLQYVKYASGETRKILELTHDVLMQDHVLVDLLLAHSNLLNQAHYFTSGVIEANMESFQIHVDFNGRDFFPMQNREQQKPRVYFGFNKNEFVDITTWERFESWYHVEQNRPISVVNTY